MAGVGGGNLAGQVLADKICVKKQGFKRGKYVAYHCFLLINFIWIILAILIQKHFGHCKWSKYPGVLMCDKNKETEN